MKEQKKGKKNIAFKTSIQNMLICDNSIHILGEYL